MEPKAISVGIFLKFELDMARLTYELGIDLSLLRYSRFRPIQICKSCKFKKTGCSKVVRVKEHLDYNFFGRLRNRPTKSLTEVSIFLLKCFSFHLEKAVL